MRSSSFGQTSLNNVPNNDYINTTYPATTGHYTDVNSSSSSNYYSPQVLPTYNTSSRITNTSTNSKAPHYTTYSSITADNAYKSSATQSSQYDRVLSSINQNLNNIYSSAAFVKSKYDSGYPTNASQMNITPNYRSKSVSSLLCVNIFFLNEFVIFLSSHIQDTSFFESSS